MHIGEELLVLGVLFVIAYVLGRLGKLIGLPAIPIYMLVGLLASPNTGWFPLNFEAANVELVAVVRGDSANPAPADDFTVFPGDTLVVAGSPEKVAKAFTFYRTGELKAKAPAESPSGG